MTEMNPGTDPIQALEPDEIRGRATAGAALLVARGGLIMLLGLVANVVLARLLAPSDFGLVALGTVLLIAGGYLADGGIGIALIGRKEEPQRAELEAVMGAQLIATLVVAGLGGVAAALIGRDALVVALMGFSLPITVLRVPARTVLERQLAYRAVATADVVEAVSFYVCAIVAVALGAGVWGLAAAAIPRAAAGTIAIIALGPFGLVRPCWSWAAVRPLLGFGLRFQANTVVGAVRDQGLNIGIASISGLTALGVWSLAYRILQIPYLLIVSFGRVAYPTMARLLDAGEDPRHAVERSLATASVALAFVLVGIAASAPALIPPLIGDEWKEVADVLVSAAGALMLSGPIYVAAAGYLFALGDARSVLLNTVVHSIVWFAVTFALLPVVGVSAVGLGWIAAGGVILIGLGRRIRLSPGVPVATNLGVPLVVATFAGAIGWTISSSGEPTIPLALLGAAAAEGILLAGLATFRSGLLRESFALGWRAIQRSQQPDYT